MRKESNHKFLKLTPIKDADLKAYEDAINFALTSGDIKNVAISGPYGSGKSSVIESYKNKNPQHRFLHISLSHFNSVDTVDKDQAHTKTVEKIAAEHSKKSDDVILEGKILNQLIHQSDSKKIPQSNFKLKRNFSYKQTSKEALVFILFLVFATYTLFFDHWSYFIPSLSFDWLRDLLLWTVNSDLLLLSGTVCLIIIGVTIFKIITFQKNKNMFRKLSFQGNEIEIFEEDEDSYFDKYLNEVLYLFENSDADVIIFEDMDRYNVHQIFEKLREINTLVNNKRKIARDTPLRFFYLLRDDVFISKDRTKFFDFIIPIVPVVDGSNSYDQFIKYFKKGRIYNLFDQKFLQELSLYIDDMRILKNIYNEFIIYHSRIKKTELQDDKLLAIITFKNIFPRDFNDLQFGKGFVHTLFASKNVLLEQEVSNIDQEIKELNELITTTEKEQLTSIDELDTVYLLSNHRITQISTKDLSDFKTRTELIRAIKDYPNEVYYYDGIYGHRGHRTLDVPAEFEKLKENEEYIRRKEVINRKTNDEIENLKTKIKSLHKQRAILQSRKLKDIIRKENIEEIFRIDYTNEIGEKNEFEEIKGNSYFPLIKYLIRHGFIDETYPEYMTYFYSNSISLTDKNFLLSVTDQIPKEYSYSLEDPELVLSRLREVNFNNVETLNFDLLCYLLQTEPQTSKYLSRLLEQLKDTRNFEFIGEFLETERKNALFVKRINNVWPEIVYYMLKESNFSHEQIKDYIIYTLYYSSIEDINKLNINNDITDYISNCSIFLDIDQPNTEKIIRGFTMLEVSFKWIDYESTHRELFKAVYKNNLYQINFEMISLLLEKLYGLQKNSDFNSKNYTLILEKPAEPLAQYVNENINEYTEVILEKCESLNDDESVVLSVLNNPEIDKDNKKKYLKYSQTIIEKIKNVEWDEFWDQLLDQGLVKYSEDNILRYFFNFELDSFLIEFINSDKTILKISSEYIDDKFGGNAAAKFFNAVVECNQLLNERYETLLKVWDGSFTVLSNTEILEEKILILIKLKKLEMTGPILTSIRKHYPNLLIAFITHNIDQYINIVYVDDLFSEEEMYMVLEEEGLDDLYKLELLEYFTDEISLKDKNYTAKVKLHVLENNLSVSDIPYLFSSYPNETLEIKEAIKNIAVEYIQKVIYNKYNMPYELLEILFRMKELNIETKKKLFANSLPEMGFKQAKTSLTLLKMNNFLGLFVRKRPKIEVNEINKQILMDFKNRDWITKFEKDKDNPDFYRAVGRNLKDSVH